MTRESRKGVEGDPQDSGRHDGMRPTISLQSLESIKDYK